jgi:hypothetical protein
MPQTTWRLFSGSPTFTVTVVVHLDLEAGQAGVAVELTVVVVRLTITATHRALVRFTLLKTERESTHFQSVE